MSNNSCETMMPIRLYQDILLEVPQNLSTLFGGRFGPKTGTTPHGSDGPLMAVMVTIPIHTIIHAYMNAYIHAYMHTCIHTCIHTYTHIDQTDKSKPSPLQWPSKFVCVVHLPVPVFRESQAPLSRGRPDPPKPIPPPILPFI